MVKKDKRGSGKRRATSEVEQDERFAHSATDPRFSKFREQKNKVKIDKRFQHMFTDDAFTTQSKLSTDKFGVRRRGSESDARDRLRKYYQLEGESDNNDDNDGGGDIDPHDEQAVARKSLDRDEDEQAAGDEDASENGYASDSTDFTDLEPLDIASSDDEDRVNPFQAALHPLAEQEIPLGEETRRIAVVNMDWSRVRAVDLFVLFSSFVGDGVLQRVSVVPSNYGKEQLALEEKQGPSALLTAGVSLAGAASDSDGDGDNDDTRKPVLNVSRAALRKEGAEDFVRTTRSDADKSGNGHGGGGSDDDDDGDNVDQQKLRAYELQRMRYYFAVAEFDSAESAMRVYSACDGSEFERSANILDLRFMPDDVEVPHAPRDEATSVPKNYSMNDFHTGALQHSKVKLTWDETDQARTTALRRTAFSKDALREQDFKAYLASDSSDSDLASDALDSSDGDDRADDDGGDGARKGKGKQRKISKKRSSKRRNKIDKYRELLADAGDGGDGNADDDDAGEEEEEEEMEITFGGGFDAPAATKDLLQRKAERDATANETPWETYQRKRKEKRKAKKRAAAAGGEGDGSAADEEEEGEEDDLYAPIRGSGDGKSKKSKGKKGKTTSKEEDAAAAKESAELELLLMPEEALGGARTSKEQLGQGFHLPKLVAAASTKSKAGKGNRRKRKADVDALQDDSFKVDLQDPRFAAVLTSHQFAPDPTDPAFKATRGMSDIMAARRQASLARHSEQDLKHIQARDAKKRRKTHG